MFAYCKAGCTPHQGKRGAETPVNTPGFQPPPSPPQPHHSWEHCGVRLAPPSRPSTWDSRIGSCPAPPSPPRCGEGAPGSLDCISAALLQKRKYKYCKGKGARGPWLLCAPWSRYGPGPESTSPLGWKEALGPSLQTTFCQPCLLPHGCALPPVLRLHLRAIPPPPLPCRK